MSAAASPGVFQCSSETRTTPSSAPPWYTSGNHATLQKALQGVDERGDLARRVPVQQRETHHAILRIAIRHQRTPCDPTEDPPGRR